MLYEVRLDNKSCNCYPMYSVWGRSISFLSSGGEGLGSEHFFFGEKFFFALVLVFVLFTIYFTNFLVFISFISALHYKAYFVSI